ncbi:MAG: hypothetical protein NWE99_08110 [Candidatus Bathyarchaeota archaeon]|nr:hypothetical protein [Candidatus Bathyarchaeota archaeon]
MNAKYKKIMKIASLLITAIIIGTVSATTYNYMYLNGSVTIGSAEIVWIAGADLAANTTISGGTATIDLTVQPGVGQNFTEALFLKNQGATDHALNITVTTTLSGSSFDVANAYIYSNSSGTWTYADTLTLTTASDQFSGTLTAGNYYRLTLEIQAKTSASGSDDFKLQVTYT